MVRTPLAPAYTSNRLTLRDCTISGNTTTGNGGGVFNDGSGLLLTLTVINCTFSGNSADLAGGAIFNISESGGGSTVNVSNSTFSGNSAPDGGGIFNWEAGGTSGSGTAILTVRNSTFSGNSAIGGGSGGAVFSKRTSGPASVSIFNSTFNGNSSSAGQASGIENQGGTLDIGNTILNNSPGRNIIADGGVTSIGYNISSEDSSAYLDQPSDQNKVTEPLLGSLADNGGPTKTHALLPGSPAIDKGKNFVSGSTTDQRGTGFARTYDDPAIMNATEGDGTDIGAYEFKDTDGDGVEDFRDNCPSPNPEKIAFTSFRDGNEQIYVMNADGSNQTNVSDNATDDSDPSFSPDGSKIAFVSNRDGNDEIYVMNVDGSDQTRLTNDAASDLQPSFSPDGSEIAFISNRDGNYEIYVMDADGMNQTNLSNNAADDFGPSFSPDGSKIAFYSFRNVNFEIYVMDANGMNQTNLTNNAARDVEPSFSPDGSKIAFQSVRDGNDEIYVMNADGSNQTRLTNNPAFDAAPSFSPDGSEIAFQSGRDGNAEIYVMNADGSGPTNVSNNAAIDEGPSWGSQADSDHDGLGDACENTAPTAMNDGYSTDEDTPLAVAAPGVLENDSDPDSGDTISAVLVTFPSHVSSFTFSSNGSFNYTPASNFNGTDTFTYKARDSQNVESNVATVTITVNAVNDAPSAANNSYSTAEDTPKNVAAPGVLGNDSDPDGDAITAVLVSGPSHSSSFTLNSNGSFNYTPASNFNGTDTFTYKARDSHNADSNTATVTITVNPVNDAPVFNSVATITRKQGRSFNAQIATVSDPDNSAGSLVVTVKTPSSGISVTNITNNNGVIKADVAAACNATLGSHTVVLKVSDGNKSSTGNLTVNVIRSDPATLTTNSPTVLQPSPNYSYQNFTIAQMVQSATDDCDGDVVSKVVIEKATSDEADNAMGPGDGNTVNDIVIAADCKSVQLRAERDGTKNGRIYQVTLRVYDSSCNATRRNYQVSVPVGNNAAVPSGAAYTVQSSCFGATCP